MAETENGIPRNASVKTPPARASGTAQHDRDRIPDDCERAIRGLETMGVRLAHMSQVATDLAHRLKRFPVVQRVLHPSLPECPGQEIWKRDFAAASGVFSVILQPVSDSALENALAQLKVFSIGASWGGTHSLIAPMSVKGDRFVKPWREENPILRISIGLEDREDLWADLEAVCRALRPE